MSMKHIKTNLQSSGAVRREMLDGAEHLVVPVVMIVDGVMNDALVTHEEYGRYVDSWNGIAIPVLHPEEKGVPITANRPDVHGARNIGLVFNTSVDGDATKRLKAELWLNIAKADRLGFSDLIANLEAGEVVEVSTGYYADSEEKAGEFNGKPYTEIHRNIRPDHLALLPGEIGACSVEDGCGTRVNKKRSPAMSLNHALHVLGQALGLKTNCNCKKEDGPMDLLKKAQALKANGKITQEQLDLIQGMDEEQRKVMMALLGALGDSAKPAPAGNEEDDPTKKPAEAAPAATPASKEEIEEMVNNRVKEVVRRTELTTRIMANQANAFDEADLNAMPLAQLEKYEKSIRQVDYSGSGGFASNSQADVETGGQPLRAPRGITGTKKEA